MSDSLQLEQMQEGSVDHETSESIYDAARLCWKNFDRQLGVANDPVGDNYLGIKELWGRFNKWTADAGAFAAPRASLDARLAADARTKNMVLELLDMIQGNLEWVNIPNGEGKIDQFSPGLPAIEAALDRLAALSEHIRLMARRSHGSMQRGRNKQDEYKCLLLVQRRFPLARESLCIQLGASIHARGISLQYMHEHNKRLAYRRNAKDDLETIEERPVEGITALAVSSMNKDAAPTEETMAQGPETANTVITRGSAVRDSQLDKYDYPPKPRQKGVKWHQPCTICAIPLNLPTLTDSDWEAHVDQDLRPYVCISEDCTGRSQFSTSSLRSWMHHMKTLHSTDWSNRIHAYKWFCDRKHKEASPDFDTEAELLNHLNTYHGNTDHGDMLTGSNIMGRLKRNRRIATRYNHFACPLCNFIVSDVENYGKKRAYDCLWKHIARHLKSLAFLSLSYIEEDLEGRESISQSVSGRDDDSLSTCSISD